LSASILALAVIFVYWKSQKIILEKSILGERLKNLNSTLDEQNNKLKLLSEELSEYRDYKGRYTQLRSELDGVLQEKEKFIQKINSQNSEILELEKQKEVSAFEASRLRQERLEWEQNKEIILLKLSEEMMVKNHQQQTLFGESQKDAITKITENIFKNFEDVIAKVKNLGEEVKKTSHKSDSISSALLTPAGAGKTSEITLENILKASSLKEKADLNSIGDYILQPHFSNADDIKKRPDAILFLPNNAIVIIDSKSSSHFLSLAIARENRDFAEEKAILQKIKESMKRHLEELKQRDYGKFLSEELRMNNFSGFKILFNIMFLQTERMLEIIDSVDPDFSERAMKNSIYVLTPIGLVNLLNQAKFVIERVRQEENVEVLKTEVKKLLDNIALVFKESRDVGKGLNRALASYNKMAKSLNKGVFSATKNISELGISTKSQEIRLLEDYEEEDV
jgi:DNA recombination protein RmuC